MHVHTSVQVYLHGERRGLPVTGRLDPKHAYDVVNSMSDLLNDSPLNDGWADRLVVTVSDDDTD